MLMCTGIYRNLLLMAALQLSIRQPFNSMPVPPLSMLAPVAFIAANYSHLSARHAANKQDSASTFVTYLLHQMFPFYGPCLEATTDE